MTARDILAHLDRRGLFHIEPGLARMERMARALGYPERRWAALHVAGTNGKGSVSATLESVLRHAGYKTGLYTSPHLVHVSERIRVGGTPIPDRAFAALGQDVMRMEKALHLRLTYFEFVTALAFLYFAEAKIDIGIIECGLGGRWDATNILPRPLASVITSIGLDHIAWLGNTRELIAGEKAGIIKEGGVTVSGVLGRPGRIVAETARRRQNTLYQFSRDFSAVSLHTQWQKSLQSWGYRSVGRAEILETPLLGRYQAQNGALVMKTVEILRERGFAISDAALREGVRRVKWPGRFQMIRRRGEAVLIVDGAHNPDAMERLCETLERSPFRRHGVSLIFSAYKDKDFGRMARRLAPLADRIYLYALEGARRAGLDELADAFRIAHAKPRLCGGGAAEALRLARAETPVAGCIVATGSLMLAGDILKRTHG